MKLENCGRCGLEPEADLRHTEDDGTRWYRCPAGCSEGSIATGPRWNSNQFLARTERVNAAAEKFYTLSGYSKMEHAIDDAVRMIDAQDAAARVRWAEMQKGE